MTSNVVYGDNKIFLGKQGENNATQIVFPVSSWIAEQGAGGVFTLNNQRPGESQSYPCTTTVNNGNVYWTITANETCYYGVGKCELSYILNGTTIAKTQVYDTYVTAALGQTDEVPFPNTYNAWKTDLLTQASDKVQAATAQAGLAEGFASTASDEADRAERAAEALETGSFVQYNSVMESLTDTEKGNVRKNAGADTTTGAFPIGAGGTGATTAADARTNLGVAAGDSSGKATAISRNTVTAPAIYNERISELSGGYYTIGDVVYVQLTFKAEINFSRSTRYRVAGGFPTPAGTGNTYAPLNAVQHALYSGGNDGREFYQACITRYNDVNWLWIETEVDMSYNGQYVTVCGSYIKA